MAHAEMDHLRHDLRTPLNAIIGFAELLHDGRLGALEARQQRSVEHILTNSRRLLDLVNALSLTVVNGRAGDGLDPDA